LENERLESSGSRVWRFAHRDSVTATVSTPIGFGRSGERVLEDAFSGMLVSPVGWVWRTSRSARWSQVSRIDASPTRIRCSASVKMGSISSTASGAPSKAWLGASAGALSLERTAIGCKVYG
jgi:hypothetical protein